MTPPSAQEPKLPLLELEQVSKSFFGVRVLKGISFLLEQASCVGLVGENGAGKSTLMNILGGVLQPDSGRMRFKGAEFAPKNPRDAANRGIAFIHQELNLFPNLSVAENIFLTRFPRGIFGKIDRRKIEHDTRELLKQVQLDCSPAALVESLSPGERQLVEIAKALSFAAEIIIFDEPTTSLTARETARLFELIKRLRQDGKTVVYISHVLSDVQKLCDRLVVLRDGEVVGQGRMEAFTIPSIISLMVGRTLDQLFPGKPYTIKSDVPLLRVDNVSQPGVVKGIKFDLLPGEVLGISGLMGSGRTELARILFGLDEYAEGHVYLNNQPVPPKAPRASIGMGMAFLTENRREEGLLMNATILDNAALACLEDFSGKMVPAVRQEKLEVAVGEVGRGVQINSRAFHRQTVKSLSGGNQQKVVLAKWLLKKPKVFILDEPTRGIDVGARYEIYRLIGELVEKGSAVLVISSEIEELIGICDRILVMSRGEITDELRREEFDRERILRSSMKNLTAAGDA